MSKNIELLIKKYINNDGKLTCSNAFKIATKLKISPIEVGNKAQEMNIRITDCDLGQFGKRPMGTFKENVLQDLKKISDEQNRVCCKDARALAKKSSLKSVRTAIKEGGLDVIYCELGCFTEKKGRRFYVKTKIWIENHNKELLFDKDKIEVLEMIKKYSSISKTSEKLGISSKEVWDYIQMLQKNLGDVLVKIQKDDDNYDNISLTSKADEFIKKYKQLQNDIEEFANKRFKELFLKDRKAKNKKAKTE